MSYFTHIKEYLELYVAKAKDEEIVKEFTS